MREDWPIIKALARAKVSPTLVAAWCQAPLLNIDVPRGVRDRLRGTATAAHLPGASQMPLPFEQAVIAGPTGPDAEFDGPQLTGILCMHPAHELAAMARAVRDGTPIGSHRDVTVLGAHCASFIGVQVAPETSTVRSLLAARLYVRDETTVGWMVVDGQGNGWVDRSAARSAAASQEMEAQEREILTRLSVRVACVLATLYEQPGHLVRGQGREARTPKETKTARLMPWLRQDLPDIRLMTGPPAEVLARGPLPTGRHAPRPHGRRGHWRHLDDGRRVFVRPAWIGPRSWVLAGRTYRMADDPTAV